MNFCSGVTDTVRMGITVFLEIFFWKNEKRCGLRAARGMFFGSLYSFRSALSKSRNVWLHLGPLTVRQVKDGFDRNNSLQYVQLRVRISQIKVIGKSAGIISF